MGRESLPISVVYALPDRQIVVELMVPSGTTVSEAVLLSQLPNTFEAIEMTALQCAIFGRLVPTTHHVSRGDRVEILRPLLIDPKESRRQAAKRGKR